MHLQKRNVINMAAPYTGQLPNIIYYAYAFVLFSCGVEETATVHHE